MPRDFAKVQETLFAETNAKKGNRKKWGNQSRYVEMELKRWNALSTCKELVESV